MPSPDQPDGEGVQRRLSSRRGWLALSWAFVAAWAAATAGLGSFVGWCIWTVLDMPSRVHAEAAEDYAKGMVRTELDLHALRALAFVVPLGALAVASAWACWPIAKHSLHGKTHVSWHRLRRHPLRAGFALVALACIVAMPVVASQDPPTHGAAEATGDGVLVPDWPPWYDSGFWTVRISAVPGAVYRYLATTCPTAWMRAMTAACSCGTRKSRMSRTGRS